MRTIKIVWKGTSPVILHSCQCVNPLHPISLELKRYTSKRSKTEDDLLKISDLEWEGGLYWRDDVGVYIPSENIEATIKAGGKANRKGSDVEKYCQVSTLYPALDYGEKLTLDKLRADIQYRDVRPMNVQRAKILRTRPRFDVWKLEFELVYAEQKIDLDTVLHAMEFAGSYVGLCDSRPRYGKFVVASVEELD